MEGEWKGHQAMARAGMTMTEVLASKPDVDLARIDATTEQDIHRHMREEGFDPEENLKDEDIISPAIIRKRLGMSQRRFAEAIHIPLATLQNWEQGRTLMDPSARSLMTIMARDPEAALRALVHPRAA
jgi:putative transcriptional regulator